jgi:RNA polymerase sigma-70 factor (ECF subfamily)
MGANQQGNSAMSDTYNPSFETLRNDPAAFAAFLEQRRPALVAYIEGRLGSTLRGKVEPQDIYQEVAIKALRELPKNDFCDRDPFGWLCHLAEQCVIDAHRHFAASKRAAGREQAGNVSAGEGSQDLIALLAASMTTPTQAAVRDEREERLRAAVAKLPEDQREALRLRYIEGLATKDVAARLHKTDVATRVLLTRLVHHLQELLEPGEKA